MQTYKCSTHQSYPYSAFLASERRRERPSSLSLYLHVPPTKNSIKRRKMSNERRRRVAEIQHPRRAIPPHAFSFKRGVLRVPVRRPKQKRPRRVAPNAMRGELLQRGGYRYAFVAEICLPKCTHVLTVFLSTFALTRTLSLSLSLSLS